jgi:hypothetical protein
MEDRHRMDRNERLRDLRRDEVAEEWYSWCERLRVTTGANTAVVAAILTVATFINRAGDDQ